MRNIGKVELAFMFKFSDADIDENGDISSH